MKPFQIIKPGQRLDIPPPPILKYWTTQTIQNYNTSNHMLVNNEESLKKGVYRLTYIIITKRHGVSYFIRWHVEASEGEREAQAGTRGPA